MRGPIVLAVILALAGLLGSSVPLRAEDTVAGQNEEQAIRKAAQDYLTAVARGDAKALAEYWTADGDLVDESGHASPAKQIIAQVQQATGQPARAPVSIQDSKIRFVAPNVALEDGSTQTEGPNGKVSGRFLAVWVKQEGKWRLASLREARNDASAAESALAGLDELAGQWSGQNDGTIIDIAAEWNPTHTYLLRDLTTTRDGKTLLSGTQRIGWDPLTGTIRAWVFDNSGGRGEATWTRVGKSWLVVGTHLLPNGQQTVTRNTYTLEKENTLVWHAQVTLPNGRSLPEATIKLERKSETP